MIQILILIAIVLISAFIAILVIKYKIRQNYISLVPNYILTYKAQTNLNLLQKLAKLEVIGQKNESIKLMYNQYSQALTSLELKRNDQIAQLTTLNTKFSQKSITPKQLKDSFKDLKLFCQLNIKEYAKIDAFIVSIAQSESSYRNKMLSYKEHLRSFKQQLDNYNEILTPLSDLFEDYCKEIELTFMRLDEQIDAFNYDQLDQSFTQLDDFMKVIFSRLNLVIPPLNALKNLRKEVIDVLMSTYDSLINQNVPLNQLQVPVHLETIDQQLIKIIDSLRHFQLETITSLIQSIMQECSGLLENLKLEQKTYLEFTANKQTVLTNIDTLTTNQQLFNANIMQYYASYQLPPQQVLKIQQLSESIANVKIARVDFENLCDAENKPLYSELNTKLNNLALNYIQASNLLNEILEYKNSLPSLFENLNQQIISLIMDVKRHIIKLHDFNLVSLTNRYTSYFDECFSQLNEVKKMIYRLPIDVENSLKLAETTQARTNELISDVKTNIELAQQIEAKIVSLNPFITDNVQLQQQLHQVHQLFHNGDINNAWNIISNLGVPTV